MKHLRVFLVVVLIAAVIIASLYVSGVFRVLAKGSVIVTLVDKETGKRIGRVGYAYTKVFLDEEDCGFVTDEGEFRISGVTTGVHKLTLNIPYYGNYTRYVNVGMWQTVNVTAIVDMPNPSFAVTIHVDQSWGGEKGTVYITITNNGSMPSVNTKILVFILREDSPTTPVDATIIDIGELWPSGGWKTNATASRADSIGKTLQFCYTNECDNLNLTQFQYEIAPPLWFEVRPVQPPYEYYLQPFHTDTVTVSWESWAFEPGKWETIAVVILDGWPFTPQNNEVVGEVNVPVDEQEAIIASLLGWIKKALGNILDWVMGIVLSRILDAGG